MVCFGNEQKSFCHFWDVWEGLTNSCEKKRNEKQKQYPVVDVTGDKSKVQCYRNLECSVQAKLEVVKQEVARVNVHILGIRELKWTGMGEFNSNDHYIYYCGQESLRGNGVAIIINEKSPKCSTWMQSQKWQNDLCSFQRQTFQYHGNPSLCPDQ